MHTHFKIKWLDSIIKWILEPKYALFGVMKMVYKAFMTKFKT